MYESLTPQYLRQLPPISAVREFMRIGGQAVDQFNPVQATFYIGLMCEELAETLQVVAEGAISESGKSDLLPVIASLKKLSMDMRGGLHTGDVMRSTHTELLDGMLDTAWVSFGAAISTSISANAAWREVARANFDKYPDGQVLRSADGKILKPANWRGPDLLPYVVQMNDKV